MMGEGTAGMGDTIPVMDKRSEEFTFEEAAKSTRALSRMPQIDLHALLLAVLSLLALAPMMQAGYFWGAHDARHSVYFLFEFDRVFQDGIWYPRWFPDMTYGYGYPLFNI